MKIAPSVDPALASAPIVFIRKKEITQLLSSLKIALKIAGAASSCAHLKLSSISAIKETKIRIYAVVTVRETVKKI